MVDPTIERVIQNYVRVARQSGIPVTGAVLFGSQARGDARENSDIDLVVLLDEYPKKDEREITGQLWRLRVDTDSRIEPVLCSWQEWNDDDCRIIIDIAKESGIELDVNSSITSSPLPVAS